MSTASGGGAPSLSSALPDLDAHDRAARLDLFARHLYGPIPPPPDAVELRREPLPQDGCERLVIDLACGGRRHRVDAALWLPDGRRPVPLIVALDFLGPIGVVTSNGFPIDREARVDAGGTERLGGGLRGCSAGSWPLELMLDRGVGLLLSCYGSWTHDHPDSWREHGVWTLLRPSLATGALSLWAWALSRLVDVASRLPDVDPERLHLTGHSRLGKAALWATANDKRVAAVVVNNAGCAGSSLSRHRCGETLVQLAGRYPHWLTAPPTLDPDRLPVDQHQLMACVAPRRLYVASASDDAWADPHGEYLALRAAAPAWGVEVPEIDTVWRRGARVTAGPVAWHLRPGGHELTAWDWQRFLPHLA